MAKIDLSALDHNLGVIRKRAPGMAVLAMVKANAYGHGMIAVSQRLERQGVDALGVAFVEEGVTLRRAGITTPIMVLTPVARAEADDVVRHSFISVVCDADQARAISEAGRRAERTASVHVYVDTGMHREGVYPHDVPAFLDLLSAMPNLSVDGICTHFATADDATSEYLARQLSTFETLLTNLSAMGRRFAHVHAANTGAIWHVGHSMWTMVRPGLSLYGYAASDAHDLRPVLSLTTTVLSKRRIAAGESVSYGRRWFADRDTTIVTIPIGYGDGYSRHLTGAAQCLVRGKRYPIVGTICMDECMIDVGDDHVEIDDAVVLIGSQTDEHGQRHTIDACDVASWAGTIPYEITTAISARVPRHYV
jgi:alanine racemase